MIRKSEVINLLCNLHVDNLTVNDKKVTEYIRELPIAYDVEKVVAKIRRSSDEEYIGMYGEHFPAMIETEDAIKIVHNGGKE